MCGNCLRGSQKEGADRETIWLHQFEWKYREYLFCFIFEQFVLMVTRAGSGVENPGSWRTKGVAGRLGRERTVPIARLLFWVVRDGSTYRVLRGFSEMHNQLRSWSLAPLVAHFSFQLVLSNRGGENKNRGPASHSTLQRKKCWVDTNKVSTGLGPENCE